MKPATSRRLRPLLGALFIALAALLGWLAFSKKSAPPVLSQQAPSVRPAPASPPALYPPTAASPKPALVADQPSAATRAALLRTLAALRALQGGGAPAETQARELLDRLRDELVAGDLAGTVAAIVEFLRGGEDAATPFAFTMEDGGALSAAPSLRTFLLDQLGRLDPVAAADFTREFLAAPLSPAAVPDESSLALRNLAWGSPGPLADADRAVFDARITALLQNPDWAVRPSAGFLEGFDAVVFSGNPALVAPLAALLDEAAAPSTRHAAHIAMDRLALAGDRAVIAAIATEPGLSAQPGLRAGLLARADVTDAAQRSTIETYLRDPAVTDAEKKTFITTFPLRSFTDGPRLITQPADPEGADLMTADRASLVVMREWATDPALAPLHPSLSASITRLESMLR
ncbi:MAG: hypothetical protein RIQ79_797 [Verrucomicrobiota bacterium]